MEKAASRKHTRDRGAERARSGDERNQRMRKQMRATESMLKMMLVMLIGVQGEMMGVECRVEEGASVRDEGEDRGCGPSPSDPRGEVISEWRPLGDGAGSSRGDTSEVLEADRQKRAHLKGACLTVRKVHKGRK